MKKPISTQLTQANIAVVVEILAVVPQTLATLSAGLSTEQLRSPLGDGERSLTQDLAHLSNCEARTSESIYLALLADEPYFLDVHPERQWGKLLRYELFELSDLLTYFTFRRTALLRVLGGLSEAQWARVIQEEGKQRKETVYWRARTMALHELEHLSDLEAKIAGLKCSVTEFLRNPERETPGS